MQFCRPGVLVSPLMSYFHPSNIVVMFKKRGGNQTEIHVQIHICYIHVLKCSDTGAGVV